MEIWIYGDRGDDNIIIFGKKYGFGELTLLENILDGIEYYNKYIVDRYGQKVSSATDPSTRSLILYGIFEALQGYHSRFSELYTNFRFRLMKAKRETNYGYNKLLAQFGPTFNSMQRFTISNEVNRLKNEKSSLDKWIQGIPVKTKSFRFLDTNGEPEYAIVVQPDFEKQTFGKEQYPLLYSSNFFIDKRKTDSKVHVADSNYVQKSEELPTKLYTLKGDRKQLEVRFIAEVFGLGKKTGKNLPTYFPGNMLGSTRKKIVKLAKPIIQSSDMLISDIMIGKAQKINNNGRFPFIPSIDAEFSPEEDLLLYFEAYNIPQGGYKIKYTVSKFNAIGIKRPIKNRQGITLLEKEAMGIQKKYLFVSLSGLEDGKFQVDIKFVPNEGTGQPVRAYN